MALIKCPECGQNISSEAYFCPGCGYRLGTNVKQYPGVVFEMTTVFEKCQIVDNPTWLQIESAIGEFWRTKENNPEGRYNIILNILGGPKVNMIKGKAMFVINYSNGKTSAFITGNCGRIIGLGRNKDLAYAARPNDNVVKDKTLLTRLLKDIYRLCCADGYTWHYSQIQS